MSNENMILKSKMKKQANDKIEKYLSENGETMDSLKQDNFERSAINHIFFLFLFLAILGITMTLKLLKDANIFVISESASLFVFAIWVSFYIGNKLDRKAKLQFFVRNYWRAFDKMSEKVFVDFKEGDLSVKYNLNQYLDQNDNYKNIPLFTIEPRG